jgi:hypothetical protein
MNTDHTLEECKQLITRERIRRSGWAKRKARHPCFGKSCAALSSGEG